MTNNPNMDFETIKKIIKIAEESSITSLSVEKDDFKVEVKKGGEHMIPVPMPAHHSVAHAETVKKDEGEEAGLSAIISPMVGTFYRAPSPDSPNYVETGHTVEKGKVVCIIEAMKLFNEIESEISGTVVKILVENGRPVEFGQKLMLIKTK